jgi:hypothetical protein
VATRSVGNRVERDDLCIHICLMYQHEVVNEQLENWFLCKAIWNQDYRLYFPRDTYSISSAKEIKTEKYLTRVDISSQAQWWRSKVIKHKTLALKLIELKNRKVFFSVFMWLLIRQIIIIEIIISKLSDWDKFETPTCWATTKVQLDRILINSSNNKKNANWIPTKWDQLSAKRFYK